MLQKTNQNFRAVFLIEFTKELIKHSKGEVFILDQTLKEEKKEFKEKVSEEIKEPKVAKEFKDLSSSIVNQERNLGIKKPLPIQGLPSAPMRVPPRKFQMQQLMIPEIRLPPRLAYLRPIPRKVEMDLGKLNPFIKDPMVRIIQCNGPDENIFVEGGMGRKTTEVVLTKEEINEVVDKFSRTAKIPVDEGVTRIFVGNLNLLAITSDVVSAKFIIKKSAFRPRSMIPRGLPR